MHIVLIYLQSSTAHHNFLYRKKAGQLRKVVNMSNTVCFYIFLYNLINAHNKTWPKFISAFFTAVIKLMIKFELYELRPQLTE